MNQTMMKTRTGFAGMLAAAVTVTGLLLTGPAQASVQGITGPTFNLTASPGYSSQPDGKSIYTWGYGCTGTPASYLPTRPSTYDGTNALQGPAPACPLWQLPGPTMIVNEGDVVTVNLTNSLPPAAGNTSIVFPGMNVTASGGTSGLLTSEAPSGTTGNTVTYTFTASKPGTYSYHSGTQPELQVEMGLYGALIVLPNPSNAGVATCAARPAPQGNMRLAPAAYDHALTCYDREYLFQFMEMDSRIHDAADAQAAACTTAPCPQIHVTTEPYHPNYFLINGRSMPDIQDTPYSPAYANQPYNGNPHMHPGELVLMRVIGQGRVQHPFHFHGNHARVIARDGNMLLSKSDGVSLAGPLMFTDPTVSGQTHDMIFTWTGQGLNWDVYGTNPNVAHTCNGKNLPATPGDPSAQSAGFDPVTHEYCPDHGKPIPITPPDPQIVANGQWYGGTPYLGLQNANGNPLSGTSGFTSTPLPPGTLNQNPEAGYAYMWHSHDEREITTNDVFPGGMLMMLLIDPPSWAIDESL